MAQDHGWTTFIHGEEFFLIKEESTRTWTKIATRRCDDLIKRLRKGDNSAIDDAEAEIEPDPGPDTDDDEDS